MFAGFEPLICAAPGRMQIIVEMNWLHPAV